MESEAWDPFRERLEKEVDLRERFCLNPRGTLEEEGVDIRVGERTAEILDDLKSADNIEGFGVFYGLVRNLGPETLIAWMETKMERIANALEE